MFSRTHRDCLEKESGAWEWGVVRGRGVPWVAVCGDPSRPGAVGGRAFTWQGPAAAPSTQRQAKQGAGAFHSCQRHRSRRTLPRPSKQEAAGRTVPAYHPWGKKPPRARRVACAHGQHPRQKPPLRARGPALYAPRSPKRLRSFEKEECPFLGQH